MNKFYFICYNEALILAFHIKIRTSNIYVEVEREEEEVSIYLSMHYIFTCDWELHFLKMKIWKYCKSELINVTHVRYKQQVSHDMMQVYNILNNILLKSCVVIMKSHGIYIQINSVLHTYREKWMNASLTVNKSTNYILILGFWFFIVKLQALLCYLR